MTTFTELFGLQTYLVKGIRASSKKQSNKASYFAVGNVLDLVVYHQSKKNIQFLKEFQFAHVFINYENQIIKHAIVCVLIEIVLHTIKQPETNSDLFVLLEKYLIFINNASAAQLANLPISFCVQWASGLGFEISLPTINQSTLFFNIKAGQFTDETPEHNYFLDKDYATFLANVVSIINIDELEGIKVNKVTRKAVLEALILFFKFHIEQFGALKSVEILTTILA